jgi:hypothetical protein
MRNLINYENVASENFRDRDTSHKNNSFPTTIYVKFLAMKIVFPDFYVQYFQVFGL